MRKETPGRGSPTSTRESSGPVVASENLLDEVTPAAVSDIPQTGGRAVGGSPCGSSNSRNRRAVFGTIASPPSSRLRMDERSHAFSEASAAHSLMSANAKLGAQVTLARKSEIRSDQVRGWLS